MRTCRRAALAAVLISALGSPLAHSGVTVTYGDPDRFTDAGDRNTDPVKVMKDLEGFLKGLGARYLSPGTDLAIEVHDLDRAGRPRGNLATEIRVMTGRGDVPCIDLSYQLTGGQRTGLTRERVCDLDYLRPLPLRADVHDPLVYDKRMLEEWFKARFAPGRR